MFTYLLDVFPVAQRHLIEPNLLASLLLLPFLLWIMTLEFRASQAGNPVGILDLFLPFTHLHLTYLPNMLSSISSPPKQASSCTCQQVSLPLVSLEPLQCPLYLEVTKG